jgi:tetratricopeptide (TPR) repeat protein
MNINLKLFSIILVVFITNNCKVGISPKLPTRNDSSKLIEELSLKIKENPNDKYSLFLRGKNYLFLNKYDEAIKDFDRVIKIDNKFINAYVSKTDALIGKKQPREALNYTIKSININPRLSYPYFQQGLCYDELGDYYKAIKSYSKYFKHSPDLPIMFKKSYLFALDRRARLYHVTEEYDKAIVDINKALELKSKDPMLYFVRGSAYYEKKMYNESLNDFKTFVKQRPEHKYTYSYFASIYAVMKDKENAEKNLIRAFKLGFKDDKFLFSDDELVNLLGKDRIILLQKKYYKNDE